MGVGVGIAMALKMDRSPAKVYVIVGNGEINEGVIWESVMAGNKFELDNLVVILDDNKIQKMGYTADTMKIKSWKEKWEAFDWQVVEVENGNDMQQMLDAFATAKSLTGKGKPVVILMKTEMGYGVDFMQGTNKYHGVAPSNDELERALAQLKETLGDY